MKKAVLFPVLVGFILSMAAGIALAEEKIGVLEPQKVLSQHPKMAQVSKQVQAIVQKKQAEAKSAIEKEKDNKKKEEIYKTKRNEAATEEQKLMAPLFKDIDLAIRSVAKAKGLTVVISKTRVFVGGVDITEDVIRELKKKAQ
ncbi:MAG: OmpH family outer membrane protein [Synergistaceae bacterium]|nr:OmpH family outer membrane protein [Synergistaceae bacterium]